MFIQTETTPNPATLKFLPGQPVLKIGTADFPSAETAGSSPLARRLFGVDGVDAVFLGNDFVTVTKRDDIDWDHIKPAILGAIMEHYQSGQPVMEDDALNLRTEATPNPATLKFLPGKEVLPAGSADFPAPEAAESSPLAQRLFAVEGVTGVFLGPDFITVTKTDAFEWDVLTDPVIAAIAAHHKAGEPVIADGAAGASAVGHAAHDGPDAEVVGQIKTLLDTRVRPAVAQDGGDITFHGFDKGIVYLHMQGACAGCPSSTLTLKAGIENLLRHYIPEVSEVRPVAD